MKTICISILLFLTVAVSLNAQEALEPQGSRRPVLVDDVNEERISNIRKSGKLTLNPDQREQIKKLQVEMQKSLNQLNNQLREKQARLQTLEAQDAVDIKAIYKNIDEQVKLLAEQMKLRAAYKQKIRSLLNNEQRVRFDAREDQIDCTDF